MRVAVLGMGRLGRSLAMLLDQRGHEVVRWSRGQPWPTCEVAWITVSDDAIATVAAALPPGPVVLHSSGASGLGVLAPHERVGSVHPILSFPGPERGMPSTVGAVAGIAGQGGGLELARTLAVELGFRPVHVPGDRRLYHAAAVLAGNFATVLLAGGARLLVAAGVRPEEAASALAPLAQASVSGAAAIDPARALTGPLPRGDVGVVQGHLDALAEAHPELLPVYLALARFAAEELLPPDTLPQHTREALQAVLSHAVAPVAEPRAGAILDAER